MNSRSQAIVLSCLSSASASGATDEPTAVRVGERTYGAGANTYVRDNAYGLEPRVAP